MLSVTFVLVLEIYWLGTTVQRMQRSCEYPEAIIWERGKKSEGELEQSTVTVSLDDTPPALKHSVFVERLTLRCYFSVSPVLAMDVLWGHRAIVLFLWHILLLPQSKPNNL